MADETTTATAGGDTTNVGTQTQDKTFTQAELNAIIADRLGREKEKYKDYDELTKLKTDIETKKQAEMTELEKAKLDLETYKQKITEAENAKKAMEIEVTKSKLMNELGLDLKFSDRVKGANEEELKADIESLKAMVGTVKTTVGGSGTNPANANSGEKNPFSKEHFNLTEQGKIFKENPAIALQLMNAAGLK